MPLRRPVNDKWCPKLAFHWPPLRKYSPTICVQHRCLLRQLSPDSSKSNIVVAELHWSKPQFYRHWDTNRHMQVLPSKFPTWKLFQIWYGQTIISHLQIGDPIILRHRLPNQYHMQNFPSFASIFAWPIENCCEQPWAKHTPLPHASRDRKNTSITGVTLYLPHLPSVKVWHCPHQVVRDAMRLQCNPQFIPPHSIECFRQI